MAGIFLFEESGAADVYKLRSNIGNKWYVRYVNSWGKVFGNDNERIINTKSRIAKKNIVLENKTEKIIQSRKKIKLNYIGKGSNSNFSNILFFKNPISGQIYKLPVVNDFIDQNCCIDVVNKYIVLIDGEEYEVDK
jgi:hypothetical protein